MACECLKKTEAELKSRMMENAPEGSEVSDGWGDTGWDNQLLSLSSGKLLVMLKYKLAYRARKKDGSPAKNLTRLETSVKMNFCPLCGVKYDA